MAKQNLTLLTDLYQLTMMQGYFKNKDQNETVIFDAFYRSNPQDSGYAISAGLEQIIEYIKNLRFNKEDIEYLTSLNIFEKDFLDYLESFHFSGDIYAIPEGSVMFPREPMIKVIAPIMEAQLIETAILNIMNHQSLIATKASRVCYAAKGDGVMEFGLRRAQGPDAGLYGARAAMIGGCIGTSNVLAGQLFDVPVKGSFFVLILASVMYAVIATGMGLLFSSVTRSQIAVIFMTMLGTMLPAVQFCGMIDPVTSQEGAGRLIGTIYPTTYMLLISRGIFNKNLDFQELSSFL